MRPLSPLLLPLLFLAGCKAEKPAWARDGDGKALPAAVCKEVAKGVEQLRASKVDVADTGEATMPVLMWNVMPAEQHDQLLRTLAFHAGCTRGGQSDAQPVVVRGDDGTELARRTISTRVDAGEILRD